MSTGRVGPWIRILKALVLRLSSVLLMAYVMLFLTLQGGFSAVGAYSAVLAVTAPVAMFLLFRYVESMSIAEDKTREFSHFVFVSVGCYLVLSPILYAIAVRLHAGGLFAVAILLYKPFEMISDLSVALFVLTGRERHAIISLVTKVVVVVALSCCLCLGFSISALESVSLALLFSYFSVLVLFDLPHLRGGGRLRVPKMASLIAFFVKNLRLGFLNSAISLNSSMPRYLVAAQSGLSTLGLFTLIYQLSATATNVIQFPVSLHAEATALSIQKYRLKMVWCAGTCLALLVSYSIIFPGSVVPREIAGTVESVARDPQLWLELLAAFVLMFLVLLFRGVTLTAAIAIGEGAVAYRHVIVSIIIATIVSAPLISKGTPASSVYGAVLYVMTSSLTASILILTLIRGRESAGAAS